MTISAFYFCFYVNIRLFLLLSSRVLVLFRMCYSARVRGGCLGPWCQPLQLVMARCVKAVAEVGTLSGGFKLVGSSWRHARIIVRGNERFHRFLQEVARCLRPLETRGVSPYGINTLRTYILRPFSWFQEAFLSILCIWKGIMILYEVIGVLSVTIERFAKFIPGKFSLVVCSLASPCLSVTQLTIYRAVISFPTPHITWKYF